MLVIYGKDGCPNCDAVKKQLDEAGKVYEYKNYSAQEYTIQDLESVVNRKVTSVPVVFENGNEVPVANGRLVLLG